MKNDYNKFCDSYNKIPENYQKIYYNDIRLLFHNIIDNLTKELNPDNLLHSECNKLIMNNELKNINKIFKNKISQYFILAECCEIIDKSISFYQRAAKFKVISSKEINQERKDEILNNNNNEIDVITNKIYQYEIFEKIKDECTLLNIIYELYKKDQGNQKVEELFKDENDLTVMQLLKLNSDEFQKAFDKEKSRKLDKFNDFILKNCEINLKLIKIETDKPFHIEYKEINLTSTTEVVKKDEKVNPNQPN